MPRGRLSCPLRAPQSLRQNLNQADQLLHGEGHIQQITRIKKLVVRKGWRGVTFGATFLWYLVRYGALKCYFSTDREGRARQYSGHSYSLIVFIPLVLYGGEGGIRTPDSLATMSDFESGAFNRALPPLRAFITTTYVPMENCLTFRCQLWCQLQFGNRPRKRRLWHPLRSD